MNREEKKIVGLMGCSHALSHGFLLIYPAVLLLLQKEFSMDYLELGIVGNIMNFCYGLGALPGGMIYNYLGPKKLFLICFLGSSFRRLFCVPLFDRCPLCSRPCPSGDFWEPVSPSGECGHQRKGTGIWTGPGDSRSGREYWIIPCPVYYWIDCFPLGLAPGLSLFCHSRVCSYGSVLFC